MTGIAEEYFPQYMRLFWDEIADFLQSKPDHSYYRLFADHVGSMEAIDYFPYALQVLKDPVCFVQQKEKNLPKGALRRKKLPDPESNPDMTEQENKEYLDDKAQKEAHLKKEAQALKECVMKTLTYLILFDEKAIPVLDGLIKQENPSLYKKIHMMATRPDPEVFNMFKQYFFKTANESEENADPVFLDRIAACLHIDSILRGLTKKFERLNSSWTPFLEKMNMVAAQVGEDDRIVARTFLRDLPLHGFTNKEKTEWFYDLLEICAKCPYNRAALHYILPDFEEVLADRKEKERLQKRLKNQIMGQDIATCDDNSVREIRPQKDFTNRLDFNLGETEGNVQLELRSYQEELVVSALENKNTIISAPTGSGKTEVAIYIALKHIEQRSAKDLPSRVVFVVPKVPLVPQQMKRFETYLGNYRVNGYHGLVKPKGKEALDIFLDSHVMVMTPEILINMLQSVRKNERIHICDISLLMFDEVHHCGGLHAYSRLMKLVIDYNNVKPQIVGLTASLLQKAVLNEESALLQIYDLMASCCSTALSTVHRNVAELNKYVEKPLEEFHRIPQNRMNPFRTCLETIHRKIAQLMKPWTKELTVKTSYGPEIVNEKIVNTLFTTETPIQTFLQTVKNIDNEIQKRAGLEYKTELRVALQYLTVIGTTISMQELMPIKCAFDYLEDMMQVMCDKYSSKASQDCFNIYLGELNRLRALAEEKDKKQILVKLKQILVEKFQENPDSRCIIFVSERSSAVMLCEHLQSEKVLGGSRDFGYVISAREAVVNKRWCQSLQEQTKVIRDFNEGRIKCVVSTSVLDEGLDVRACNLIIKYNCSSSAVGRIQKAGRARAMNSKSILLCLADGVANSEFDAIIAGIMLNKCIETIIHNGPTALERQIKEVMKKKQMEREAEEKENSKKIEELQDKDYRILCSNCERELCDSNYLRIVAGHTVIVDPHIWDDLVISLDGKKFEKNAKYIDQSTLVLGDIYCRGKPSRDEDEDDDNANRGNSCELLGKVMRYSGCYLPQIICKKVSFRRVEGGLTTNDLEKKEKWREVQDTLVYVHQAKERDFIAMLQAISSSKFNKRFIEMEALCDGLLRKERLKVTAKEKEEARAQNRSLQPARLWESSESSEED